MTQVFEYTLVLCLFVILECYSHEATKCNSKSIIDLKTREIKDADKMCKDEVCIVRLCNNTNSISMTRKGIRKCTPLEEVEKLLNRTVELPNEVYSSVGKLSDKKLLTDFRHVAFTDEYMYTNSCTQFPLREKPGRALLFLEDGSIEQEISYEDQCSVLTNAALAEKGTYIMEFEMLFNKKLKQWVGARKTIIMLQVDKMDPQFLRIYYLSGRLITTFFLLLLLVIYWVFMKFTIVNFIFMAHVAFLALGYGLKSASQITLMKNSVTQYGHTIMSSMWYFSYIASFFWMNVMGIELCSDFCGNLRIRMRSCRQDLRRLGLYAIYALGVPASITIFAHLVDGYHFPIFANLKKPCFSHGFQRPDIVALYLYIPVSILVITNFFIFIFVSIKIRKEQNLTRNKLKTSESKKSNEDRYYSLYVKLMFVTGLNWIFDLVELISKLPEWLSLLLDSNVFIGLIIFIVFILCNKKLLKQIRMCQSFRKSRYTMGSQSTSTRTTQCTRSLQKQASVEPRCVSKFAGHDADTTEYAYS